MLHRYYKYFYILLSVQTLEKKGNYVFTRFCRKQIQKVLAIRNLRATMSFINLCFSITKAIEDFL